MGPLSLWQRLESLTVPNSIVHCHGGRQVSNLPVDRFLALERSTDAIAIVSRFWSSEILSKSAVFDELNSLTAL